LTDNIVRSLYHTLNINKIIQAFLFQREAKGNARSALPLVHVSSSDISGKHYNFGKNSLLFFLQIVEIVEGID
jgi:hypothetical protein